MKYFPELKIDFMTLSKFAPLLEGHPHINKVHAVDINAGYKKLRQVGFEMEMMGYDLAIDLHNTTRSQVIRRGLINTKNVHIKKPRWKRFKLFTFHKNDFQKKFSIRSWLHESIHDFLPDNFSINDTHLFVSEAEKSGALESLHKYGLKGKYFLVHGRAKEAEIRGCSDVK